MITTAGKMQIKRYLVGYSPNLALAIAWGIGQDAETLTDVSLGMEVGRADITFKDYDFVDDTIVFKCEVPENFVGTVYEVGLYSAGTDASSGAYGSRIITTFDSATENWNNGTYTTVNTRVGADSLNLSPAASGTLAAALTGLALDFSGNSGADQFTISYTNNNAFASTVAFRFKTDASNYYTFSTSAPATGFRTDVFNKSAAVVTGTPSWNSIVSVEVTVSATSGGAANVDFEGIRIEDRDTINQDYVLIAREVISPIVKLDGQSMDIEYSLDVNI